MFIFFVDSKAAFDTADRRKLGEILEKIGIKEHLRRRIMETRNIIKSGKNKTKEFGVSQRCPKSPTLFNIYIMDLEKEMRKEQTGGVI